MSSDLSKQCLSAKHNSTSHMSTLIGRLTNGDLTGHAQQGVPDATWLSLSSHHALPGRRVTLRLSQDTPHLVSLLMGVLGMPICLCAGRPWRVARLSLHTKGTHCHCGVMVPGCVSLVQVRHGWLILKALLQAHRHSLRLRQVSSAT